MSSTGYGFRACFFFSFFFSKFFLINSGVLFKILEIKEPAILAGVLNIFRIWQNLGFLFFHHFQNPKN